MDEVSRLEQIARGVRGLSIAVWCLVAINVVQIGAWIVPLVAPNFYVRHTASSPDVPRQMLDPWEGLTFEEKVKRASIVLLTENKREGGKIRAVIKEELKRAPNTTFNYSVGDEYGPASISEPKEKTQYGDGAIVLMQGSPAINRGSFAIYNGSVPGLGDMSLSKVREIVAASK